MQPQTTDKEISDHSVICDKITIMHADLKKEDWGEFESYFDENVSYKVEANDHIAGQK